jgi:hypothetical protein
MVLARELRIENVTLTDCSLLGGLREVKPRAVFLSLSPGRDPSRWRRRWPRTRQRYAPCCAS